MYQKIKKNFTIVVCYESKKKPFGKEEVIGQGQETYGDVGHSKICVLKQNINKTNNGSENGAKIIGKKVMTNNTKCVGYFCDHTEIKLIFNIEREGKVVLKTMYSMKV